MKLLTAIDNKIKDAISFRIVLLACSILLIFFREPDLFLYPRMWAEEGSIFYAFALHHSLYDIFFTIHVGYLTLFNSIVSAIQAKIFSVENAATVSTYLAFLIQLTPVYIIAFTNNLFWNTPLKKIFCVFIVVIVMPHEVWLNTTNSHFIFGIITFLIMIVSVNELTKLQKHFFRFLLVLGGLTGPASIFFTPVFLLKAYREKTKEKYIQASIITLCSFIQAFIILFAILFNNTYNRLSVHDLKTTRYHFIVDNFSLLPHTFPFSSLFFSTEIITLFGLFIGTFYIYLIFKNIKNIDNLIPLVSVFIVAILSTLGSLNMMGGSRYGYTPTCILLIIFTTIFLDGKFKYGKYISLLIVIVCLSANAICYRKTLTEWAYNPAYPKWKTEVAKWRIDSTYHPKNHPAVIKGANEWQVKL